ncbi:SLC13 family permease, partial [Sulfurimonas sp.]|uniref:SLC13 family permease n=1 Tax=Sulfurimonas sp. TaxID=2022749 RepID=UPI0026169A6D
MLLEKNQLLKIAFSIIVGVIIYALGRTAFSNTQSELLGIIALLVILWTNEALPLGVVSLLPIVLFPAFGIISTKATTINYANPIIYLFLGGFLLAIAVEKSKLHMHIADKLLSLFPSTPRGMIFSLSITTGLLSSILSNTTTTLLLMPIALFLTKNKKLQMRFALAIA